MQGFETRLKSMDNFLDQLETESQGWIEQQNFLQWRQFKQKARDNPQYPALTAPFSVFSSELLEKVFATRYRAKISNVGKATQTKLQQHLSSLSSTDWIPANQQLYLSELSKVQSRLIENSSDVEAIIQAQWLLEEKPRYNVAAVDQAVRLIIQDREPLVLTLNREELLEEEGVIISLSQTEEGKYEVNFYSHTL